MDVIFVIAISLAKNIYTTVFKFVQLSCLFYVYGTTVVPPFTEKGYEM